MKVLFVLDSLGTGGAERSTAAILPHLRAEGVDASVVVLRSAPEGFEAEVRGAGFDVEVLVSSRFIGRMRELRRILERRQPDILHTSLHAANQVGRIASMGMPVKVISSIVRMPPDRREMGWSISRAKYATVGLLDRLTGRLAVDRFHAVTPGVRTAHIEANRIDGRRITVVERGRDPDELGSRTPTRRATARSALGIEPGVALIAAVGRHEPQKGFVDLVSIVPHLLPALPSAQVVIAGNEGTASAALRAAIEADPQARNRIHLLGHRDDVADIIAAADVFVLPSTSEGAAGVVIEAMALGTPIVAHDLAGLSGILVDGYNALTVQVGDRTGFSTAVERVLHDHPLAAELVSNARRDFQARFTARGTAVRMLELYEDVASG